MKNCPKMKEAITQLAHKHGVDLAAVGAHFRLDMPGYERLCVETISAHQVSVAHYYEMNGDLVPDPDIVFFISKEGAWSAISITDAFGQWRSYVKLSDEGQSVAFYDQRGQADLADFAEIWAQNLKDQKWLENSTCTRSSKLEAESNARVTWPKPTTEEPTMELLLDWFMDGDCEATDGCIVEPDGVCPHGHPSWLLKLGMM